MKCRISICQDLQRELDLGVDLGNAFEGEHQSVVVWREDGFKMAGHDGRVVHAWVERFGLDLPLSGGGDG